MGLSLLAPLGLLALLAWLVPLWIHRVRRPDTQPIAFAALRWLRTEVRPQHQRRMDEWWLLCLRLLLLAMLALWLAQPLLQGQVASRDWQLIAPEIPVSHWPASGNAERRWLAPGFPLIDDVPAPPATKADISSVLREADMRAPSAAHVNVVLPHVVGGWDAERPKLSRKLTFQTVEVAPTASTLPPLVVPVLVLHADAAHTASLRWFRASHVAWQSTLPETQRTLIATYTPNAPMPDTKHVLAWLSHEAPSQAIMEWVQRGGTLLLPHDATTTWSKSLQVAPALWRDALGQPLLRGIRTEKGRILQLQRPMTVSAWPGLMESDFPAQLQRALQSPREATRASVVTVAPTTGAAPWPQAPRSLQAWLAVIVAVLWLLERIFANLPSRVKVRG